MNRFFLPPECFEPDRIRFDPQTAHQIYRVLRLKRGDQVIVLDGTGIEFSVILDQVSKGDCSGEIDSRQESVREPKVDLHLLVGLTQREKFEWVLQKCTEIGVKSFTPVTTSRSLVQDIRSAEQKMERWHTILKEAAEQSGRGIIPTLYPPVLFLQALEKLHSYDLGLIAYEGEEKIRLRKILRKFKGNSLGVFVGPEGGFSQEEIQHARQSSLVTVSLGPRILRMETAALVVSAMILYDLHALD